MGAQLNSGGKKKGAQPNINVTPLVDVVLVLLIIFMVVLPDVQGGKPIEMVKVGAADKHSDSEPLTVTIDLSEVYTWDDADTTRAVALAGLQAEFARDPKQRVLLRADAGLRYAIVRDFFRDVQNIGFPTVSLAVGVGAEWKEES